MNGVLHEDDHLLVMRKPAGINTHAPSPYAGQGIYEWLKCREPRWATLGIVHRLDKETSGVMVFTKSPLANRSLTQQFTERKVKKSYVLLTDKPVARAEIRVEKSIVRLGDKYAASRLKGEPAETVFKKLRECSAAEFNLPRLIASQPLTLLEAQPLTGRTHQIRVHAAEAGFPILGDELYGGSPAPRVFLHAQSLEFFHPATGQRCAFEAPALFEEPPFVALRVPFIDVVETNAWRIFHGATDGRPQFYADKLGPYTLAQSAKALGPEELETVRKLAALASSQTGYHKVLTTAVRQKKVAETSPRLCFGEPAPDRFAIRENGLQFELSFQEGYSVGIFLDQRDNRRRLLTGYLGPDFVPGLESATPPQEILNTFAYTCAFSVCAAKSGARVTSLDLSKKYLEWGKRNFVLNQIDPAAHDFIYGDVMDWLARFAKRRRTFDLILLDPPTFSVSKQSGVFRAEKDYPRLVRAAVRLLRPNGVLFASSNASGWEPTDFLSSIRAAIAAEERIIEKEIYFPQPPDFPISRAEPAYLKTVWLRLR